MSTARTLPYPVVRQVPNEGLLGTLQSFEESADGALAQTKTDIDLKVAPEDLLAVASTLKKDAALAFDFLRNISGVDLGEAGMELKYQLYSFEHGHTLQLTVPLPPHNHPHPSAPSLTALYPAADWLEREAAEMFGIHFEGHPNLKNLLLEEDLHIHPLLKAHPLQKMEIKQGIEDGPAGFNF
jgi:NADH-quinone oxidoreductase subunit C